MKTVIPLLLLSAIVGLLAGYALGALLGNEGTMDDAMALSMDDMAGTLRERSGEGFDLAFLDLMIAHHQGAVEMATLARERAEHEELRAMAEAIIVAQTEEIATMRGWKGAWS